MKKFYKGTLITALICIVFGLGMVVAGAVQGGFQLFLNMVDNNEFAISGDVFPSWYWFDEDVEYEEGEYYFQTEEVEKLNLDIGASILEIKYADTDQYYIHMQQTPVGCVSCNLENGVLFIESSVETPKISFGTAKTKANKITLTIPENAKIKEFEMILGAGSCTGKYLSADNITIEVGAGNLELDKLEAEKSLSLLVGAGNVEANSIEAGQLEVECGAGRCFIDGAMTVEDIDVTCDAGYVHMDIEGTENSYNYDLECSVGSIKMAGKQYSGLDFSKEIDNDAEKTLTAECNVGCIEIDFEK